MSPGAAQAGTAMFEGGCLCGDIRYSASGGPDAVNHCHCVQCQRASGAAMATWATWPLAAVRFVRGAMTEFESSPGVRRGFCARCGSTISWRRTAPQSPAIDLAAGTLDDPDPIVPADHLFTKSRRRWLPLCDGLPAYREHRPRG